MGHLSKIFEELPIEVQRRNGFDLSHVTCGTAKCGQLTPVLKRLIMPNTKLSLGLSMNVELPPLATSFFGRIDGVVETFFVPCSILYGGFRQFISNQLASMFPDSQTSVESAGGYVLPYLLFNGGPTPTYVSTRAITLDSSNNGLLDYLGFNFGDYAGTFKINMLPLLAYHKICDTFYRNPQVTKTWFAVNGSLGPDGNSSLSPGSQSVSVDGFGSLGKNVSLVWHSFFTTSIVSNGNKYVSASAAFSLSSEITFPDGIDILSMRQRPWARDYFTSGLNSPQQGDAPIMKLAIDDNEAMLSISMIRAANSLQRFVEHNGLSMDYKESMRTHFGVNPSDALLDEPMYLGRLVVPVYQKSIYNSNGQQETSVGTTNPYSEQLGGKGAHGSMTGEGSIVENFHAKCFGYLMGLFSLVPHTMYNYGIDKDMLRNEIGDFPFPELQSVGMDSIKDYEVFSGLTTGTNDFCYTQRYAYEKYINDSAHGELRPGKSLESFVLQRSFASQPEFGTEFTLIPQDALDKVFAVSVDNSKLSCWYEIYWVFKASMPLAEYCIPTLGDLKDTYTIKTKQGGSRL